MQGNGEVNESVVDLNKSLCWSIKTHTIVYMRSLCSAYSNCKIPG